MYRSEPMHMRSRRLVLLEFTTGRIEGIRRPNEKPFRQQLGGLATSKLIEGLIQRMGANRKKDFCS